MLSVLEATMQGAEALPHQIADGLRAYRVYRRFRTPGAQRLYAICI
jgi:hypothetical protein